MVGSIASSPAVDLSALPSPEIVPAPDFEVRLADKIARLVARHPAFTALVESDPAIKLLEADSYDELVLAQACNDAARSMLLAFARGANLDQLGALMDVPRLTLAAATSEAGAVMESDTDFRQRIQLAPHRFSVAGPGLAYVFHARAAHGDVADATAVSPAPGDVVVTVLARSGNGVPSAAVLGAVNMALQDSAVRPMTDRVTVQAVQLVDFAVEAELDVFAGPDRELILDAARASLSAHLAEVRRLDRDIVRSALIAALHVGNVQRVRLISPPADIPISAAQIGNPTRTALSIVESPL
ncbi:baseplate assembly protein [Novosphingobium mangrovi (ex Hu et al. 2023)]|uniref:Baseplate J/gp47 family protein n=1 Tax=Novosphingobium mangrovi (ex Hu et al. 2023) TaxID=2930094 RepID=A0ABT0A8W4_9SPHN|nr:baseplate J/gp47 family protein [Novosphingobium mangrovi (ex Hu et al. 2023)]MCJ1959640.1 baseplate J/gp47 family protein [Novosphingobium mangrovi (ex Hu et al. 2023)]